MADQGNQGGRASLDVATQRIVEHIEQAGLPESLRTVEAAAGVLCVFSRLLSKGEADDLSRCLPESLQRLVQPCAEHRDRLTEVLDRGELVKRVAEHLGVHEGQAEICARAVFQGVRAALPQVEVERLRREMPGELWELWGPRRAAA